MISTCIRDNFLSRKFYLFTHLFFGSIISFKNIME